ncbi:MAG: HAD family hydrolase [archaeon]
MRQKEKNKIKAIGFDFDGTLIMSEDRKAKAMADVFKEKFDINKGVSAAYTKLMSDGKTRHEKVVTLFKQFVKRKSTLKELKEIEDHFGKHYERELNVCPLFQCTNIIKELKNQVNFLFLLSLENKREVKKVAAHCGLAKYFDEILGGPKSKIENLKHIIKKHKLKPEEIIYIGDSNGDVIAGKQMGIEVVLIRGKFNYQQLLDNLQADFVFNSICDLPHDVGKY